MPAARDCAKPGGAAGAFDLLIRRFNRRLDPEKIEPIRPWRYRQKPALFHDSIMAIVLRQAYEASPLRFQGCVPQPPALPTAAWIHRPKETASPGNAGPGTVISDNRVSQSD